MTCVKNQTCVLYCTVPTGPENETFCLHFLPPFSSLLLLPSPNLPEVCKSHFLLLPPPPAASDFPRLTNDPPPRRVWNGFLERTLSCLLSSFRRPLRGGEGGEGEEARKKMIMPLRLLPPAPRKCCRSSTVCPHTAILYVSISTSNSDKDSNNNDDDDDCLSLSLSWVSSELQCQP